MELDKMQFAHVLAHCISNGMSAGDYEIEELDRRIDVPIPEHKPVYASPQFVNDLMRLMAGGEHKIEAIKAYHQLTGEGLRASKDAVERYWNNSNFNKDTFNRDGLYTILRNNESAYSDEQYSLIKNFIGAL